MDWKTVVGFTIIFHALVYAWRREWILRMDTRKLNSAINAIGQHPIRKYLRVWFRIGTYATIILGFPFTLFLFIRTIFYALFPSIVAVAIAVTPSSLLPGSGGSSEEPLELHHEQLSPYPDANIPIEEKALGDGRDHTFLAIQPILPGWNLPIAQLPYYLLAILISVVIHELGHAIASAAHKVPIQSVGVSIFGPLIPAAHVELNSIQLRETPIKKQLDILTAGVWMNLYLALITYFVVPLLLPALLYPTHSMGNGLTVTAVWPNSGIGGPGGLDPGDVILGIENCPVKDLDSWYTCLEKIWQSEPVGYCVGEDVLMKFANNSEGCCGTDGDNSPTHLCFLQMDTAPPHIDKTIPPNLNSTEKEAPKDLNAAEQNWTSYCLPAQPVVAEATELMSESVLSEDSDFFYGWEGRCHGPSFSCAFLEPKKFQVVPLEGEVEKEIKVVNESHCFLPRLVRDLKRFRIVTIQRRQDSTKTPVLFVGNVMDLSNGVRSTEYVPRSWFLSRLFGFSGFSKFPEKLETVLLLTAGLSAGLAVVNMLPIYGLDGYHIVDAMARSYLDKRWDNPRKISRLVQFISWIALAIALLTVFCSLAQAI